MPKKRYAILEMFHRGIRQSEIVRGLGLSKSTVSDAVLRFKELGHDGDRPGKGKKPTSNNPRNRKIIKKRVGRNCKVSMRKIAREIGLNRESVRKIAIYELGLKPYKSQKVQLRTDENKRVRLQRCRLLQRRAAGRKCERKKGSKSTRKYIDGTFFRPSCFYGPNSTSAMHIGPSNRTQRRPTRQKLFRSFARHIFQISFHLLNGRPTRQI